MFKPLNRSTMPEWFTSHGAGRRDFGTRHVRAPTEAQTGKPLPKRSSTELGYGYKWQVLRAWWLRHNPLCVRCREKGLVTEATEVDHILPHKGNKEMFWDRENLQSLCKKCHSMKTATEDGGFGNRR